MTTTRIFLASTLADGALKERLGKAELPDGVELATANEQGPRSVKQVSLRTLENCHAFLGVFGAKYGAGQALELRRAEEREIPRAILISEEALDKPLARLVAQVGAKGVLVRRVRPDEDLSQAAEDLLLALSSRAMAAHTPAAAPVAQVSPAAQPIVIESKAAEVTPVMVTPAPIEEPNPFASSSSLETLNPFGAVVEAAPIPVEVPAPPAHILAPPPVISAPVEAPAPVAVALTKQPPSAVNEPAINAPKIPGRARVVADLLKALQPKTRILLRGADGIGKSVVARAVSQAVAPRFPDGVYWIEAGERGLVSAENRLAWAIKEELVAEHNRAARHDKLKEWFGNKRALLVLDDGADKDLWPLLSIFAEGAVLIAARELPGTLSGQALQVIDVPPLSAEEGEEVAKDLWGEIELSEARELSKAAGGAPLGLAITIADAKAQKVGARQTAAALSAEKGDSRIEAAAKRALSHVSETHRLIFGITGALPTSSFAAAAVAIAVDLPTEGANQMLQELAAAKLLVSLGNGRYQLPSALRAMARAMPSAQGAELKFAAYYREFSEAHREVGRIHLDVMENEREGIMLSARAMSAKLKGLPPKKKGGLFSRLFGRKEEKDERQETAEFLIDIANHASTFTNVRGYWSDWKELCSLGIEGAIENADQTREAKLLLELASVLRLELNPKDAKVHANDAIAKFEAVGDRQSKAQALHLLALITWEEKKPKEALDLLNQAIQSADPQIARTWGSLKAELENAIKK